MEEDWLSQRSARENIFPMDSVDGEHLSISWLRSRDFVANAAPYILLFIPQPRNRDMTLINY